MAQGDWLGSYLGEWAGYESGPNIGSNYVNAALNVTGSGSSELSAVTNIDAALVVAGSGSSQLEATVAGQQPDTRLDQILALLTGTKVYDSTTGLWRVYDAGGTELADESGVLMRGFHGWMLYTGSAYQPAYPETEWPVQPGAFAPLSRPSSPITRAPFKRRARQRRDQDLLIL